MGTSDSSGLTSITGNVSVLLSGNSVPLIPTGATYVYVSFSGTGATQHAYTSSANKTFYLMGIQGSAAVSLTVFSDQTGTQAACGSNGSMILFPTPPAKWYNGEIVHVNGTNAAGFTIWGFEI